MGQMKAPTDKRTYDGALHANLMITLNAETYSTPGFDHQYPLDKHKYRPAGL